MRRHPLFAHHLATRVTSLLLICFGLSLAGCSDSRLDPAGLRQAGKSALVNLPLGDGPKPRPVPRPRPRPRAVAGATIPTPPYRLDVRVDPADLSLLPPDAAWIAAVRPDFFDRAASLLAPYVASPGQNVIRKAVHSLISRGFTSPPGLRRNRAVLIGAQSRGPHIGALAQHLDALVQRVNEPGAGSRIRAAIQPTRLPAASFRVRMVGQVKDAHKLKAHLTQRATELRRQGQRTVHLTSAPTTPKPLRGLAANGVVAVRLEPRGAESWSVVGERYVVDILQPISGPWTAARVARELSEILSAVTKGPAISPFDRIILMSSADLALLGRGPTLAQVDRWKHMAYVLDRLRKLEPDKLPISLKTNWSTANQSLSLLRAGARPFDGFGVRVYLLGAHPQLRLSWHLTGAGTRLVGKPTTAATGLDLALNNGLVERWLKPMAARIPRALPPVGPFAEQELDRWYFSYHHSGLSRWLLALAEFWPRLLPMKPVRKRVLKFLRTQVRPERFVRRINVRQHGKLLELVLEGKPPRPARKP